MNCVQTTVEREAEAKVQSQGSLKKQQSKLAKLQKSLASTPVVIKRNSKDGQTCFPGEVTAANVCASLLKHKQLEVDPSNVLFLDESMTFPIKKLGSYNLVYVAKIKEASQSNEDDSDDSEKKAKGESEEYVSCSPFLFHSPSLLNHKVRTHSFNYQYVTLNFCRFLSTLWWLKDKYEFAEAHSPPIHYHGFLTFQTLS
jgi:hypothetical protein